MQYNLHRGSSPVQIAANRIMENSELKLKTARTIKWNTIDKLGSQVLYAITGIILANVLDKVDFGLVGSLLIFQAFASLFVDSGFSSALIQKKSPTQTDYSTVFYFNLAMSIGIYVILWFAAPLIASVFHDDRLIDLARVMFLTFILNATAIVQTNRLMKQMDVKFVTIGNCVGLVVSGAVGIYMALTGYGAWAIVWQSISLAAVKSGFLWIVTKWTPDPVFSMQSLKSIFAVGSGVMVTSFLNTVFLNVYQFIIGAWYSLTQLGIYTQAEKWSKMGVMSLSQTLTASFLPVMSEVQDDKERFHRALAKTNRLAAYLLFPCFFLLLVMAEPIFHLLFNTKWDEAIPLFQILIARGIFTVLTLLYNNYILSVGKAKMLVYSEIVKDIITVAAIVVTVGYGLEVLVWGQLVAGIVCYLFTLYLVSKATGYSLPGFITLLLPYIGISFIALIPAYFILMSVQTPLLALILQLLVFGVVFVGINALLKSKIQSDVFGYVFGRLKKK